MRRYYSRIIIISLSVALAFGIVLLGRQYKETQAKVIFEYQQSDLPETYRDILIDNEISTLLSKTFYYSDEFSPNDNIIITFWYDTEEEILNALRNNEKVGDISLVKR